MGSATVLIVENDLLAAEARGAILASIGYAVHTATTAADALRTIERVRPACVLLDTDLPDMDGLSLARRLKADPATQDIVIVAVAARADQSSARDALRAGCVSRVPKCVGSHRLAGIVTGFLTDHRRARRAWSGYQSEEEPARQSEEEPARR